MVRAAGRRRCICGILTADKNSCFYGIDTPARSSGWASSHSVEEMADLIGADSLPLSP